MILAVSSTEVLFSINSALLVAIVFLALQLSKMGQRIARLEERTNPHGRETG